MTKFSSRPPTTGLVEAAETLSETIAAGAAERDRERLLAYDELNAIGASGILSARVPAEYGGPELSWSDVGRIFMALSKGDPNVCQALQPHMCVVEKFRLYGDEEQRKSFFGQVLEGKMIANAVAERGGKVVGQTATTLVKDGYAWRMSGRKFYSTGSIFSDLLWVTGVTEDGNRAIAIIPTDREGVEVLDDWDGIGQRTTASGTTILDNVLVHEHELLKPPAAGSQRSPEGALAQLLHAAIDVGIGFAALRDGGEYCRTIARPVPDAGVDKASHDLYAIQTFGQMAVMLRGAEALVERAGRKLDEALVELYAGRDYDRPLAEASIAVSEAKAAGVDSSLAVSEKIFSLGGASACSRSLNLDRHWRNARTHTTHDPIAYKLKAIGNYYLNGELPPISLKI
ncbi:MAG: acyl-CoA dehydrogenase family protein [Pseudomonadota bacterium]|nr:acyl-CoA dehydrogenase family protein [Pseudomonadota bacterium]